MTAIEFVEGKYRTSLDGDKKVVNIYATTDDLAKDFEEYARVFLKQVVDKMNSEDAI